MSFSPESTPTGAAALTARAASALVDLFTTGGTNAAMFTIDHRGIVTTWNAAAEQLFGYSETEIVGQHFSRLLPAEDGGRGTAYRLLQAAAERGPVTEDRFCVRKNGTRLWVSAILNRLPDNGGEPAGFVAVFRDVSTRKRLEAELSDSREQLTSTLEQLEKQESDREGEEGSVERLQLLSDVGGEFLSSEDPVAVLDRIFQKLRQRYFVDVYFHFQTLASAPHLWLRTCGGTTQAEIARVAQAAAGYAVCGWVADNAEPMIIADVQQTKSPSAEVLRDIGVNAYACFPLFSRGKLLGTLSFGSRRVPRFDPGTTNLLRVITDLFAAALARHLAVGALSASERRLQFLNELGEVTRSETDPLRIMDITSAALGRYMNVSRCAYATVEEDQEHFTIAHDYAPNFSSSAGRYVLSAFGPLAHRKMRTGEQLILHDVKSELPPEERAGFDHIEIQAIICCPFMKGGRLRAMMAVHSRYPRIWSDEEVKLVALVAERCWSTIERARAELQLAQNEKRLTLAMEAAQLGMWELDMRERVALIDARVAELFGIQRGAGPTPLDVVYQRIHPEDRALVHQGVEKAMAGSAPYEAQFRVLGEDGQLRWLVGRGDAVTGLDGERTRLVGVNYDITLHKQAEETLKAAQATLAQYAKELERAVATRTSELQQTVAELERFSYSLSHDLRAPLRAMTGFSQVLQEEYGERLDEEGRRYLDRIAAAARRLDQLILDVLNYAQIVRADIRLQPTDVERLLKQLLAENPDFQAPRASVSLRLPLHPVLAHEAYLTQCLTNLLTNAVKFIRPGELPKVEIWTEQMNGDVRICVCDHGVGIDPKWKDRIFGMFERLHPAGTYEGTGIGLSIVRKAAERMDGSVGFTSAPGQGSTFWVQLRAAPPA